MDESPYGVRGVAGNVRDWCQPNVVEDGRITVEVRTDHRAPQMGGDWANSGQRARGGCVMFAPQYARDYNTGFRIARSWP